MNGSSNKFKKNSTIQDPKYITKHTTKISITLQNPKHSKVTELGSKQSRPKNRTWNYYMIQQIAFKTSQVCLLPTAIPAAKTQETTLLVKTRD